MLTGHWLFDPKHYAAQNPGLTDAALKNAGFIDGYDHYLKHGAAEGRPAHPFFDPATYAAAADCATPGAFEHFLSQDWGAAPEPQVSPHFDPVWYRSAYPDVAEQIPKIFHSALHHFLVHGQHAGLSPLPRIKIHIDRPAHRNGEALEPVLGHLDIIGWAAANHRLVAVDVFIDDENCGRAYHGLRTEGVAAAFPELTHALFAGFRFVGPSPPSPGRRRLRIVARGESGAEACETVDLMFQPAAEGEGPWSLRRRMRASEAGMKRGLLPRAGAEAQFCIVLRDTHDADATARTLASLHRQVFPNWHLQEDGVAPGAWIVALTPGDELGVDALLELALHRRADPAADYIYSDERRIDPSTGAMAPFFKPDWSPDLLRSFNYIGRLWAASPDLVARAGLTPSALAHTGAWEAARRLAACATRIAHLPLVLCESAAPPDPEPAPPGRPPAGEPLVSIIIPTAGAGKLIDACLHMLHTSTDYPRIQIIVIDTVPGAGRWNDAADLVIEDGEKFNWSRVNNRAAAVAQGDLLLFLNDDVCATDAQWLRRMVEVIGQPEVGVVGPRLLYPGGKVQHAGMFLDGKLGRHAFVGCAPEAPGPFGLALTQRNVSAVTGACLLTRRDVFDRLGGFDERLDLTCNDVDFCLRCLDAGFLVTYTPHATLTHHESATRAGLSASEAANEALFQSLWRTRLARGDPYFSPHLSLSHGDYRPEPEFVETLYPARPLAAPSTIRRILLIKLDHIGDFILALPAIRRLRAAFAHARLTLLASPAVCDLARLEPTIDETIDAPGTDHFDLAIDLRCHADTRPVLERCAATWRAGFDAAHDHRWLDIVGFWEPDTATAPKRTHMTDTLLDFAAKIEAAFSPSPLSSPSPSMGEGRGGGRYDRAQWPKDLPTPPEARLRIAIHPAAGTEIKQWPPAHFATLIDQIAQTTDAAFILLGTASDTPIAQTIAAAVNPNLRLLSLCGLTDVPTLARLLTACDLLIGNDSGPHHLAATLGVPTLGIHAGVVDAQEWSPRGPEAVALRRRMRCSPCYIAEKNDCPRSVVCLNELTPGQALTMVHMLVTDR